MKLDSFSLPNECDTAGKKGIGREEGDHKHAEVQGMISIHGAEAARTLRENVIDLVKMLSVNRSPSRSVPLRARLADQFEEM